MQTTWSSCYTWLVQLLCCVFESPSQLQVSVMDIQSHLCTLAVIECDRLRDIANGQVQLSGTAVGSTATYSCNRGYILVGKSTRVCQSNGEWSGREPFCKRKCSTYSCPYCMCSMQLWIVNLSDRWTCCYCWGFFKNMCTKWIKGRLTKMSLAFPVHSSHCMYTFN